MKNQDAVDTVAFRQVDGDQLSVALAEKKLPATADAVPPSGSREKDSRSRVR